jgi:hypothetical protein
MQLEEQPQTFARQFPAVRRSLDLIPLNNLPGRLTVADIIRPASATMPRLCLRRLADWAKALLRSL